MSTAYVWRGVARWGSGRSGWQDDLRKASAIAADADPLSQAAVTSYRYGTGIMHGVLVPDDVVLREVETVLRTAERCSDDMALVLVQLAMSAAQFYRGGEHRRRGIELVASLYATCVRERFALNMTPLLNMFLVVDKAEHGERDSAIGQLRTLLDEAFATGNGVNISPIAFAFVENLLARGSERDLAEAEGAIERAASWYPHRPLASRDVTDLRLRALLAKARGDDATYRDLRDRYRAMAEELGFEGHMKWAAEMP